MHLRLPSPQLVTLNYVIQAKNSKRSETVVLQIVYISIKITVFMNFSLTFIQEMQLSYFGTCSVSTAVLLIRINM